MSALTLFVASAVAAGPAGPPPPRPLPAPTLASLDAGPPELSRAYRNGRRMHIGGNIAFVSGAVLLFPSAVAVVGGAFSGNVGVALGGSALFVASLGGIAVGPVLSNVGALRATSSLDSGPTVAFGAIGLGCMAGSAALALIAASDGDGSEPWLYAMAGLPVASVALGVVQMQVARSHMKRSVWTLPTPGGLVVAGRF